MGNKRKKVAEGYLKTFFQHLTDDLMASPKSGSPAVQRQLERMAKRAEMSKPGLAKKAIDSFLESNAICKEMNRGLNEDEPLFVHMKDFISYVTNKYARRLDPSLIRECIDLSQLNDLWTFGPGTSNGCTGSGTVLKIDQPMTCTESALPFVRLMRGTNPYFLAFDSENDCFGLPTLKGSRLTTTLKNEDADRTIAIEPSGNMAMQLAAGRMIEGVLRMIGCDLSNQQDINKNLARIYSINDEGGTIDAKCCSDMFSIEFVRVSWPEQWYLLFLALRSPETELPDGRSVQLEMISTMGNGFTFPMMTLTLIALIYAVRRIKHGPRRFVSFKGTAVFGDDIIVPNCDFDDVCTALQTCGLIVNSTKSFKSGPFRESCGGDYHLGEYITPFYARRLTTTASRYVVINQLLKWSATHEVVCYKSLKYLLTLLGSKEPYVVPQWMPETSGILMVKVAQKYKYLRQEFDEIPYQGSFMLPLAAGGYISSAKGGAVFTIRVLKGTEKYHSRKARLPRGYLDGWDPGYGTLKQAAWSELMVQLAS